MDVAHLVCDPEPSRSDPAHRVAKRGSRGRIRHRDADVPVQRSLRVEEDWRFRGRGSFKAHLWHEEPGPALDMLNDFQLRRSLVGPPLNESKAHAREVLSSSTPEVRAAEMGGIWLITGPPGVGKTTTISRVAVRVMSAGVIVGGCTTSEKRSGGARVGFAIKDLSTGRSGELASATSRFGPKVGRYRVNLTDLASVGGAGLASAAERAEMIVIDEVGPMELVSPEFRRGIRTCIDSGKPMLAVVHQSIEDDLIAELKSKAIETIELSVENRDEIVDRLSVDLLKAAGGPKSS